MVLISTVNIAANAHLPKPMQIIIMSNGVFIVNFSLPPETTHSNTQILLLWFLEITVIKFN